MSSLLTRLAAGLAAISLTFRLVKEERREKKWHKIRILERIQALNNECSRLYAAIHNKREPLGVDDGLAALARIEDYYNEIDHLENGLDQMRVL